MCEDNQVLTSVPCACGDDDAITDISNWCKKVEGSFSVETDLPASTTYFHQIIVFRPSFLIWNSYNCYKSKVYKTSFRSLFFTLLEKWNVPTRRQRL